MSIQKLRLERNWSQEHLAQTSGLSLRTIQRIESGQNAGIESLSCLAAALDTNVSTLKQELKMQNNNTPTATINADHENQKDYINNIKSFKMNFFSFAIIMPILLFLNLSKTPDYFWILWVALFWGISFILHFMVIKISFGKFDLKDK